MVTNFDSDSVVVDWSRLKENCVHKGMVSTLIPTWLRFCLMITTGCVLIVQGVGDNLYHTKMNNKTDSSK